KSQYAADLADGLLDAVHHVAGYAVLDDLGNRAVPEGKHRRAAGHGLDHNEPERLGPVDREQQRARIAQEPALAALVDLADEFDAGLIQQRCNLALEIRLVDAVDLRRDLQRQADGAGYGYRAVDALLRRYATKEGEIAATSNQGRGEQVARDAVRHSRNEVGVGDRTPLCLGYRD